MTKLTKDQLLDAYRRMRTIREFEERIHKEFATGAIPGFVHLYAGQEASATGVCMHLRDVDYLSSTHRGHGHCIAKGVDPVGMMAEIYGKSTGLCRGKGGSMHIADISRGMLGANGIVGAGGPLSCGAALASKIRRSDSVTACFFGDGASNQGTILESMNFASILKLPVVFVAENNGYGEACGASYSVATENIADRAAAFGMPGAIVDGFDFFAVYEAAGVALERARKGNGPTLLETKTGRFMGHYEGDAQTYRAPGEVEKLRAEHDCLVLFRKRATRAGLLTDADLDAVDAETRALIDRAVSQAQTDPTPDPEKDLVSDVYVSYA
jgi:acetoin:2,6-dichlorophenolindophenol oxidoreductase subunit alpha